MVQFVYKNPCTILQNSMMSLVIAIRAGIFAYNNN